MMVLLKENDKRGMFIPGHKLRPRLTRKDKARKNSYADLSNHIKQLQKEYTGDDASYLYPSSQHYNIKSVTTLVLKNPQQAYKYENDGNRYQSATLSGNASSQQPSSSYVENKEIIKMPSKKKIKNKTVRPRTRSVSNASSSSSSRDKYH